MLESVDKLVLKINGHKGKSCGSSSLLLLTKNFLSNSVLDVDLTRYKVFIRNGLRSLKNTFYGFSKKQNSNGKEDRLESG